MTDRDRLLDFCRSQIGKPYLLGACGPDAFDCSALIWCGLRLLTKAALPRVSTDQYALGYPIDADQAAPGDLVFFDTGWTERVPNHLGIVSASGQMINANSVSGVIEEDWQSGYWHQRFTGARRIFDQAGALQLEQRAKERFNDLPASHPHFRYVMELVKSKVVSGYPDGSFRADQPVSRAEAVKMMLVAFVIPVLPAKTPPFADVAPGDWFADAVAAAKKQKILSGSAASFFRPQAAVNRAELIKMLFAAARQTAPSVSPSLFADVPPDAWFAPFAHAAMERGMFVAAGDCFLPDRPVTRGEICRAIIRLQESL